MLSIEQKKYLLKIKEVYFAKALQAEKNKTDIVVYTQCMTKSPGFEEFKTLHINLAMDEKSILDGMTKNTRYEIRRAALKDNLSVHMDLSPEEHDIREFAQFYDGFAKDKGLSPCSRKRLSALRLNNALGCSVAKDGDGIPLCYHVYIIDQTGLRVRLLYSASFFRQAADQERRNLIGRANRYLHWADMTEFKKKGFRIYDMGGIAPPGAGNELERINFFKKMFGGIEVTEFKGYKPESILGKIAIKAMDTIRYIKSHPRPEK